MSKTESVACFTVTGEFVTETARSWWAEEDEPTRAINLLKVICGEDGPLTDAQCMDILEGRKKLIGDSSAGIEMVDDKANGVTLIEKLSKLQRERDEARDERADLRQMVSGDTAVLASPTGLRRVPRRKTKQVPMGFGFTRTALADDVEFSDLPREKESIKPLEVWQQLESSDFTPEEREEADEALEAEREAKTQQLLEHERKLLLPEPRISGDTGWLTPGGEFYRCGYGSHARTLWVLGLAESPAHHSTHPDGWVRLSVVSDVQQFHVEDHSLVTDVQKKAIRDYCEEAGDIDLPWWMREKDEDP